jgi:hypothetical protein
MKDKEIICSRCGKPGSMNPCPYQKDADNATDEDAMCDCCSDCNYQCAMDI